MEFRIADTFTDSLARLTGEEQKAIKTTAFDLQMDPSAPAMQFHRIDRAKDPNFWSVRVSRASRKISQKDVLAHFSRECNASTVKRDLQGLRKMGLIETGEEGYFIRTKG